MFTYNYGILDNFGGMNTSHDQSVKLIVHVPNNYVTCSDILYKSHDHGTMSCDL